MRGSAALLVRLLKVIQSVYWQSSAIAFFSAHNPAIPLFALSKYNCMKNILFGSVTVAWRRTTPFWRGIWQLSKVCTILLQGCYSLVTTRWLPCNKAGYRVVTTLLFLYGEEKEQHAQNTFFSFNLDRNTWYTHYIWHVLCCEVIIDLKLKEFPNVWGEYKNHSIPIYRVLPYPVIYIHHSSILQHQLYIEKQILLDNFFADWLYWPLVYKSLQHKTCLHNENDNYMHQSSFSSEIKLFFHRHRHILIVIMCA